MFPLLFVRKSDDKMHKTGSTNFIFLEKTFLEFFSKDVSNDIISSSTADSKDLKKLNI